MKQSKPEEIYAERIKIKFLKTKYKKICKGSQRKTHYICTKSLRMAEFRKSAHVCHILKEKKHLPQSLFIARSVFKNKEQIQHFCMEENQWNLLLVMYLYRLAGLTSRRKVGKVDNQEL